MGRPKEGQKSARAAAECFKRVNDKVGRLLSSKALAEVSLKMATPASLRAALRDAEDALLGLRKANERKEEVECLTLLSKIHAAQYEYEDAVAFAKAAAALAQSLNDPGVLASALLSLASVLLAADEDAELVSQIACEALDLYKQNGDWLGEIDARLVLAKSYHAEGLLNYAMDTLQTALKLARRVKSRKHFGDVLDCVKALQPEHLVQHLLREEYQLAGQERDRSRALLCIVRLAPLLLKTEKEEQLEEVQQLASEAVLLASEIGVPSEEAKAQRCLSDVLAANRDFAQAAQCLEVASAKHRAANDICSATEALRSAAGLKAALGQDKEATQLYLEQRNLYKNAGWKEEEATAVLTMARLHLDGGGDPKEASKAAKEAITMYQKLQDKAGEAQSLLVLGSAQLAMSNDSSKVLRTVRSAKQGEVLKLLRQAQTMFQEVDDAAGESQALQAVAEVYLVQGLQEEAVKSSHEALKVAQVANNMSLEADALRAIAAVHLGIIDQDMSEGAKPGKKDVDFALSATLESLTLLEALGDLEGQTVSLTKVAKLQRLSKDPEAALATAKEALQLASKLEDPQPEGKALMELSEALVALKRKQDAETVLDSAKIMLTELRDKEALQRLEQLVKAAEKLPDGPPPAIAAQVKPPPPAVDSIPEEQAEDSVDWSAYQESYKTLAKSQEAALRRRNRLIGDNIVGQDGQPNQEARRQQSRFAAQAGAGRELPPAHLLPTRGSDQSPQFESKPLPWQEKLQRARDMSGSKGNSQPEAPNERTTQKNVFPLRPVLANNYEMPGKTTNQERPLAAHHQQTAAAAAAAAAAATNHASQTQSQSQGGGEADTKSLSEVLQMIRPDWKTKDILAVIDKLQKVQVTSANDLFITLQAEGPAALNTKLKAAGQKALKVETLEALQSYGQQLLPTR